MKAKDPKRRMALIEEPNKKIPNRIIKTKDPINGCLIRNDFLFTSIIIVIMKSNNYLERLALYKYFLYNYPNISKNKSIKSKI